MVPPPKSDRSICTPVTTDSSFGSLTSVILVLSCSQVIATSKPVRSILSPSVALKSEIVSSPLSSSNTKVSAPPPPVIVSSLAPPWSSSLPSPPVILSR